MVKLVGADHVGIGLDYDPGNNADLDPATTARYWPQRQYPQSIKTEFLAPAVLPEVARQLRARGYGESKLQAIMCDNFMRIAAQVWQAGNTTVGASS